MGHWRGGVVWSRNLTDLAITIFIFLLTSQHARWQSDDIYSVIKEAVEINEINPAQLALEITESVIIIKATSSQKQLTKRVISNWSRQRTVDTDALAKWKLREVDVEH